MNGTSGCLNAMVAEKSNPKHKHVKVLISVGGRQQEGNFARIARDFNLRHTFAASVKAFLDHYGLDGVDSKLSVYLNNGKESNIVFSRLGTPEKRRAGCGLCISSTSIKSSLTSTTVSTHY
jgi:hypothetical protein